MKNHWIKRREDKDLERFKHSMYHALNFDQVIKEIMMEEDRRFMEAVNAAVEEPWFGPTSNRGNVPNITDVFVTDKALEPSDIYVLYGREDTCKCCGLDYKSNVGHQQECFEYRKKNEPSC